MTTTSLSDPELERAIDTWVLKNPSSESRIQELRDQDPEYLKDCFTEQLVFGTGGLRGLMDVGPNRMNTSTVASTTQGICNYLLPELKEGPLRVCIAYDSRDQSFSFAKEAAQVFLGNQIGVYLFESLRPLPLLSFTVREKNCRLGIMITASHNPCRYNGYKVFGADGGQILSPVDQYILQQIRQVNTVKKQGLEGVTWLGPKQDQQYLKHLSSLSFLKDSPKELKLVYSPLYGTGITLFPQLLKQRGFHHLTLVASQKDPHPHFPTAPTPNPADPKALEEGLKVLKKEKADLLLATDPDADRLGVVERLGEKIQFFNGHEIGCMLLHYILCSLKEKNALPSNGAVIKSLVTTSLIHSIAKDFGISCFDVHTGFKYIGEKITSWELTKNHQFLFACEESHGYLFGTHVRDKDALIAGALLAELAWKQKQKGKSLLDYLQALYQRYGTDHQQLFEWELGLGSKGLEEKERIMESLRNAPPLSLNKLKLENKVDFLSIHTSDDKTPYPSNPENMLKLQYQQGVSLMARPSGTEPKIKFYLSYIKTKASSHISLKALWQNLKEKLTHTN